MIIEVLLSNPKATFLGLTIIVFRFFFDLCTVKNSLNLDSEGYTPSEELTKELQNHVKHATAPYKYPRIVEYVKELPKTLGGKIKRKELREEDERMYAENK